MTDLAQGIAVFPAPACYFCHRPGPIAAGTYTRINFTGIGVVDVCDDCRERGDEEPDEWTQHHEGYDLVIDGGDD